MAKKIIILIFIFMLLPLDAISSGYDVSVPVNGDSIASDSLQISVINDIYSKLSKQFPYCFDFSISDSQIVHYPYDVKKEKGKYIKGNWKELWSVNTCGTITQIPVTFIIKGGNTAYIIE